MIGQPNRTLPGFLLVIFALLAGSAFAQPASLGFGDGAVPDLSGAFDDLGGFGDPAEELKLSGQFRLEQGSSSGKLEITAKAEKNWHVYSLTQKGGPGPTKLTVVEQPDFKLSGPFTPDRAPHTYIARFDDGTPIYPDPLEEFEEVVWTAPIQLAGGVSADNLEIEVNFVGQVCSETGGCKPIEGHTIVASYAGRYEAAKPTNEIQDAHVTISGHVEPRSVKPGGTVRLVVTAAPAARWHIYPQGVSAEVAGGTPTSFILQAAAGLEFGQPQASSAPIDEHGQLYHEGQVSWTFDIKVADDASPGPLGLSGIVGYQVCSDSSCDQPAAARFQTSLRVGEPGEDDIKASLAFTRVDQSELKQSELEQLAGKLPAKPETVEDSSGTAAPKDFWKGVFVQLDFRETESGWSRHDSSTTYGRGTLMVIATAMVLMMGFVGGLILNVMPCVLPVIGLKLMSFVQQAGESRRRVFLLNVWYSVGILSIFLVFATISAILHFLGQTFSWGEHLGDPRFAIPLLSVVFVLALSMFGVWEIPIPGFVGSNKASALSQKEGPSGAFFKGALTTILATPCSGPFIGVVVGIAVVAPIWLNFALFFSMALGMAFPFLVIGAFPRLMKWLPRPGAWMDTVKQFMGFVLLATCVWIIYFLEDRFIIPSLSLLIGFGIACWIIGRIPIVAERQKKMRGWLWAMVVGGCAVMVFGRMVPAPVAEVDGPISTAGLNRDSPELPWQKFTVQRLEQHRKSGKTVFVDFTADW